MERVNQQHETGQYLAIFQRADNLALFDHAGFSKNLTESL